MAPLRKRSRTKTHKNTNLPEHKPEELDNMSPSQYEQCDFHDTIFMDTFLRKTAQERLQSIKDQWKSHECKYEFSYLNLINEKKSHVHALERVIDVLRNYDAIHKSEIVHTGPGIENLSAIINDFNNRLHDVKTQYDTIVNDYMEESRQKNGNVNHLNYQVQTMEHDEADFQESLKCGIEALSLFMRPNTEDGYLYVTHKRKLELYREESEHAIKHSNLF